MSKEGGEKKKATAEETTVNLGLNVKDGEIVMGVCHIYASFNDTFVHVTDPSGRETLVKVTGGMKVKADRDEASPYAAMLAAQDVAAKCKDLGIGGLHIKMRATVCGPLRSFFPRGPVSHPLPRTCSETELVLPPSLPPPDPSRPLPAHPALLRCREETAPRRRGRARSLRFGRLRALASRLAALRTSRRSPPTPPGAPPAAAVAACNRARRTFRSVFATSLSCLLVCLCSYSVWGGLRGRAHAWLVPWRQSIFT